MSRIGIIRDAIVMNGGNHITLSYADNTAGWGKPGEQDGVHKVPRWHDGLTAGTRQDVVDQLNAHPDVKLAYLSRGFNETCYNGKVRRNEGGHLKVRFYGLARG